MKGKRKGLRAGDGGRSSKRLKNKSGQVAEAPGGGKSVWQVSAGSRPVLLAYVAGYSRTSYVVD